jgi:hypothetical protein
MVLTSGRSPLKSTRCTRPKLRQHLKERRHRLAVRGSYAEKYFTASGAVGRRADGFLRPRRTAPPNCRRESNVWPESLGSSLFHPPCRYPHRAGIPPIAVTRLPPGPTRRDSLRHEPFSSRLDPRGRYPCSRPSCVGHLSPRAIHWWDLIPRESGSRSMPQRPCRPGHEAPALRRRVPSGGAAGHWSEAPTAGSFGDLRWSAERDGLLLLRQRGCVAGRRWWWHDCIGRTACLYQYRRVRSHAERDRGAGETRPTATSWS